MATLKATKRTETGSNAVRRLRAAGNLPAVVYGHKKDPISVTVDYKEFITILRHHERLIKLEIDGELKDVFIKDAQYDVLGDNILHADFEWVDLDELVPVTVEVKFRGDPAGLKEGGAVHIYVEDVEIEVPAGKIPEVLKVDISELKVNDKLTLGDIVLPEGASIVGDESAPLVACEIPTEAPAEEAPAEEGEAATEAPAEE